MTSIAIPLTTNNFILQPDGKYKVSFDGSAVASYLTSAEYGAARCYRTDGQSLRQVLFYNEIDAYGNVTFIFDEVFSGKIVLTADA